MLRAEGLRNIRNSWTGFQAHHVIPREFWNHRVMQRLNMDIDHASNGEFLPIISELAARSGRSLHDGPHEEYNRIVGEFLDDLDTNVDPQLLREQVIAIREHLRAGLLKGIPVLQSDPNFRAVVWERWMGRLVLPR